MPLVCHSCLVMISNRLSIQSPAFKVSILPAEEGFAGIAADAAKVEAAAFVAANAAAFPHAVHSVLDPGGPRVQPPGSRVGPDRLDDLRGLRGDGGRDSDGGRRVVMARKDNPLGQVWPIHRIQ